MFKTWAILNSVSKETPRIANVFYSIVGKKKS